MERSADRYLHKKFKKQLSIEPSNNKKNADKEEKTTASLQAESSLSAAVSSTTCSAAENPSGQLTRTCDSVPKVSTNSETDPVVSPAPPPPPPPPTTTFLLEPSKSSISPCVKLVNDSSDVTQAENLNTCCISYVISKSSRLVEDTNHETHQDESTYRSVNFDKRFNVNTTEPIEATTTTTTTTAADTSSILENVYSKQYVTSKLVNLDKLGDISSSSNVRLVSEQYDDVQHQHQYQHQSPVVPQELSVTEKASGGKYICSYCNLACSKPSVLQKHIRAHTNERPYPCVSCGFSFKTRSNLYKHCRSRTHANRVMGNKAQELQAETDTDSQNKLLDYADTAESGGEDCSANAATTPNQNNNNNNEHKTDIKTKPYKPRFHTAKAFFDSSSNQNEDPKCWNEQRPSNPDLLSLHINEVINKNNAIVNSNESYLLRKRSTDESHDERSQQPHDEPLNLTNKNRKRCLSEVAEPTMHTSLIKELLLKNLYADTNMQCPHCKMIFQTVTELELHKIRSCKGFTKTGARYSRSSSVNVASILTKNKNAFDNIPYLQNATFSLKSPGPFLGKTRLVESDKSKSFSFDDGLPTIQSTFPNSSEILRTTLRYSVSPLTIQHDKVKQSPVKLFGGEVKITHTSGETKSFKIDSNKDHSEKYEHFSSSSDYGGRLSENRVVKSSLQSGGTVLQQNKPNYNPKQDLRSSPDVIRVYENTTLSPSIDIASLEKTKFNFDRQNHDEPKPSSDFPLRPDTKYTNIVDFSQKAVKLLAPNLKQPNLAIPGLPVPSKILTPQHHHHHHSDPFPSNQDYQENIQFAQKQILLQQKMSEPRSPNVNPVNLLVNGKVVRYVPGMPGPVAADVPLDVAYSGRFQAGHEASVVTPTFASSPAAHDTPRNNYSGCEKRFSDQPERVAKSPKFPLEQQERMSKPLEIKTSEPEMKSPSVRSRNESKTTLSSVGSSDLPVSTRKFARPNTLALKPSLAAQKQHHGLTPTMFNQILISPDTPRVAKKYMQHFLHGNYFSYLGLKSSTKPVYCTLNKTQPTYVPHFKKLSMYSEWRQQDTKADKSYVSAYDSRQRQQKYVTAGKASVDLVVHSSYKFTITEAQNKKESEDSSKSSSILGGYESNEDYTYVRGRGRGRYVCDQCGIRCKKPSMLKKHIRTHTNDRPFTCSHCNFSFKTKGNLTKHMKSKAHTKNYAASSSSSSSSAQQSGTQSSESDTEDSGMDSSDESTRQQEHEAAYGLLSLSQKTSPNLVSNTPTGDYSSPVSSISVSPIENSSFMNAEQVTHVNNKNFARNKFLDQRVTLNFNSSKIELPSITATNCCVSDQNDSKETQNFIQFLGKTNTSRPLTYPYTSDVIEDQQEKRSGTPNNGKEVVVVVVNPTIIQTTTTTTTTTCSSYELENSIGSKNSDVLETRRITVPITITYDPSYLEGTYEVPVGKQHQQQQQQQQQQIKTPTTPVVKVNDRVVFNSNLGKRKPSLQESDRGSPPVPPKLNRLNSEPEAMDLSMPSLVEKPRSPELRYNGNKEARIHVVDAQNLYPTEHALVSRNPRTLSNVHNNRHNGTYEERPSTPPAAINLKTGPPQDIGERISINYVIQETHPSIITTFTEVPKSFSPLDYDNSAMETLADVATKQVKLEKNTLAKSVASEYLKLTKQDFNETSRDSNFIAAQKEVNELIVKPEENKSCTICAKNFSKPSQLRLHMNIHYLERPFRCDPCSVSFRTKGHLQKHERSASHHNKLSSSPLLSSSEPRPFKCSDCNIAFRIHGHLAKHLRSKMHIMKLECLAKIPFGLYAELERANSLLTEINTTDGDQCLESLKALARKVFINDPSKLNRLEISANMADTSGADT